MNKSPSLAHHPYHIATISGLCYLPFVAQPYEIAAELAPTYAEHPCQVLLATQAHMLEAMLTRVAETVAVVNSCPGQASAQVQRLSYLLSQSEQFLTTLARQYVGLERETAQFQAVGTDTERLHMLDQVTTTLHANLTAARRYLAALRPKEL